ncbi:MAG: glycosyltransferase family 2 protein [Deltaproteobacteria bacterium]|nr:glycosyltransferase family 2 protein [Deltaproteobacteria bacterium]
MKLIIQIPCYNEAETISLTLGELPREVEGFNSVEWLIINDGCTDDTVTVAKNSGVNHVVSLSKNKGLATAFMVGLETCLKLGADVIVNTDADNQYEARDISKLVKPILEGKADIVIGARPINEVKHFSAMKRILQKFGSYVVRLVSKTDVADAPSGFRAISRDAAMHLNVFNEYTYTLETIIQAGQKNMTVTSVPIRTNKYLRPSRLIKSIPAYLKRSILTIIRIFVVYQPFRFFMTIGLVSFSIGLLIGLRYLYYLIYHFVTGSDIAAHVQSLILASILIGIGFQTILVAFLADLLSVNRKLMEDIQYRLRKTGYYKGE